MSRELAPLPRLRMRRVDGTVTQDRQHSGWCFQGLQTTVLKIRMRRKRRGTEIDDDRMLFKYSSLGIFWSKYPIRHVRCLSRFTIIHSQSEGTGNNVTFVPADSDDLVMLRIISMSKSTSPGTQRTSGAEIQYRRLSRIPRSKGCTRLDQMRSPRSCVSLVRGSKNCEIAGRFES